MVKNLKRGLIKRKNIIKWSVFLVVLVFTFILRAHNYERVPTAGHLDEQLYALSGLYLIEDHIPVSWSTLSYPESAQVFKGQLSYNGGQPQAYVTLYKPWLDEPPLFSLLVGSFAKIYQADKLSFIPSSYIRMPVVFISTITSVLVFMVACTLSGFWIALLAMVFYSLTPTFLISSRTAMPENLIALILILVVYLVVKYQKYNNFKYLLFTPILIGIAGLSKPTGFFILPLLLYYFIQKQLATKMHLNKILRNKRFWYLVIGTLPFVLFYFCYGYHFDWQLFKKIFSIQSARPVGFGSLSWLLISPAYSTTIFKDAWYVFAIIAGVYYIFKPKTGKAKIISFTLVYWFLVIMFSGGEGDLLAWYRYPLFPFLSISAAWGFEYLYDRADFFASFITASLLLGNRPLLVTSLNKNVKPLIFRITFFIIMLPSIVQSLFNVRSLKLICRLFIIGIFVLGAYYNIVYIYNAFDIICEGMKCPTSF